MHYMSMREGPNRLHKLLSIVVWKGHRESLPPPMTAIRAESLLWGWHVGLRLWSCINSLQYLLSKWCSFLFHTCRLPAGKDASFSLSAMRCEFSWTCSLRWAIHFMSFPTTWEYFRTWAPLGPPWQPGGAWISYTRGCGLIIRSFSPEAGQASITPLSKEDPPYHPCVWNQISHHFWMYIQQFRVILRGLSQFHQWLNKSPTKRRPV